MKITDMADPRERESVLELETVDLRHPHVGDETSAVFGGFVGQERGAVFIWAGGQPFDLEEIAERLPHGLVVIHDRDHRRLGQAADPH